MQIWTTMGEHIQHEGFNAETLSNLALLISDRASEVRVDYQDEVEELKEALEAVAASLDEVLDTLDAYRLKDEDDARKAYEEMIDESCPDWRTPGAEPSRSMREQDPTAYRCGFNDWLDGEMQEGNAPPDAEGWTAYDVDD